VARHANLPCSADVLAAFEGCIEETQEELVSDAPKAIQENDRVRASREERRVDSIRKWCAQGDDSRTFLGDFVACLPQPNIPAGLSLQQIAEAREVRQA
jgi:hypothetical protein